MKVGLILGAKGADVIKVKEAASIRDAVELLGSKNIGAVIVENDRGDLAGILSERDVVRHLRTSGPSVLDQKVSTCMTPKPFTCTPEETVDDLLARMTEKRIRHLPVVEAGKLVGVVSIGDVVKRKIELAEREAAELKQYIAS